MHPVPDNLKSLFESVEKGTASAHRCIKAMCHTCLNYNLADIKACTSKKCPLYSYRPGAKRPSTSVKRPMSEAALEGLKKYRENKLLQKPLYNELV